MRRGILDAINRLYSASMFAISEAQKSMACRMLPWGFLPQKKDSIHCEFDAQNTAIQGAESDANLIMAVINDQAQEIEDLEKQLSITKISKNAKAVLKELEQAQEEVKKAQKKAAEASAALEISQGLLDERQDQHKEEHNKVGHLLEELKEANDRRKSAEDNLARRSSEKRIIIGERDDAVEERDAALVKVGSMTIELEKLRAEVELLRPKSPIGKTRRKLDFQRTS